MKLNLLFFVMDLLTLLAYPIVLFVANHRVPRKYPNQIVDFARL
jgi:hypothetical protein